MFSSSIKENIDPKWVKITTILPRASQFDVAILNR